MVSSNQGFRRKVVLAGSFNFALFLRVFLKRGGVSLCYKKGERRMRETENEVTLGTEDDPADQVKRAFNVNRDAGLS